MASADWDDRVMSTLLAHLEQERGNSVRSRNARLAAIHSLFGFAALRHPEHAAGIARVLATPPKRADQTIVTFLTSDEAETLLAAPTPATRTGPRDPASIPLPVPPGPRASQLTARNCPHARLRP